MSDCIFCKIIDGDIPCAKVYEDEHVLAFLDISQVTKGHTLVIPKIHKENIYDMTPEVSNHYFQAGQSVFHYHMHIIPRYGKGDGFGAVWKSHQDQYTSEDLKDISSAIHTRLTSS